MDRRSRALWLPGLAVLVPCAFIGVLGYKWLALERDAAARRSTEAAQSAIAALRRDLATHLQQVADDAAHALGDFPPAPFIEAPTPAAPAARVWLFDASSTLVAPDPEGAYQRAVEEYRIAATSPAWQQVFNDAQRLEQAGRRSEATTAAHRLMAIATTPGLKASALLSLARLAAAADQPVAADKYAATIPTCCPTARDEYGVSFALYAAWQRMKISGGMRRSDAQAAEVAAGLKALIDGGYLGHPIDVTQIELLARTFRGHQDLLRLVDDIGRARAAIDQRIEDTRLAVRWLSSSGATDALPIPLGLVRQASAPTVAARLRVGARRTIVLFIDPGALTAWVAQSGAGAGAFDLTLRTAGESSGADPAFETPLVPEEPTLRLAAHQRRADGPSDRRRERLFGYALAAMIILTLALGILATRDVSREMRTAAMRSSFVAAVTHELKTPLASIRLLTETLRWDRARPERRHELLETILGETDRLSRLVDNALSSSRIDAGTQLYRPQLVPLANAVRSAVRRLDSVLDQERIELLEQIEDESMRVRVDPDALGQSVLNLLGNAVKYSGTSRQIRVTLGRNDGMAEIRVADDGIGIDPAEHGRIFDRFYRSPEAAAHTGGAGLGLPLVKHFAEAHGGRVTVTSAPGRGSTFSVWLPLANG